MMTPDKKKGRSEAAIFLDNLADFLGGSEEESVDQVKRELLQDGIDIEALVVRVKGIVNAKLSEAKRTWLKEAPAKRSALMEKLNSFSDEIPKDVITLRKIIKHLMEIDEEREFASAFFRNFTALPDEDLKALYLDYLRLKKMKENKSND